MSKKNRQKTDSSTSVSRRQFAKTVAVGAVAAIPFINSMAQTPTPSPKEATAPPKTEPSPTLQQPSPVVAAYTALAIARFGEKFNEEQMRELRQDVEGFVRSGDRLKTIKLKNGDEPDFMFEA